MTLEALMSHCKRIADVNKISHCSCKLLEILVLCLITHGPVSNQGTNSTIMYMYMHNV